MKTEAEILTFSQTDASFLNLQAIADKFFNEKQRILKAMKHHREHSKEFGLWALEMELEDVIMRMNDAHDKSINLLKQFQTN